MLCRVDRILVCKSLGNRQLAGQISRVDSSAEGSMDVPVFTANRRLCEAGLGG